MGVNYNPEQIKITVECHNDNQPERSYVIRTVFGYLGIQPEIVFCDNTTEYVINCGKTCIIFNDAFFIKHQNGCAYLSPDNVPQHIQKLKLDTRNDLIVLFGDSQVKRTERFTYCGADIFASTFFMLTRFEEYFLANSCTTNKDIESRLLAVRENFYQRAVVNEYVGFLEDLLREYGILAEYEPKPQVILSHDVDRCYLSSTSSMFKNVLLRFIREHSIVNTWKYINQYFIYKRTGNNPFDTFDEFMNISEEFDLTDLFLFKATEYPEIGHTYSVKDNKVQMMIHSILERGHTIGIHPSEDSFNIQECLCEQVNRLKIAAGTEICFGRNHTLLNRIENLRLWEKAGIHYSSNCGFQYRNGFRSGCCRPYSVFDCTERRELDVVETPFLAMESVWYRNRTHPEVFFADVAGLVDTAVKFNGTVCLNWHSNMFNMSSMNPLKPFYRKIVQYAVKKKTFGGKLDE